MGLMGREGAGQKKKKKKLIILTTFFSAKNVERGRAVKRDVFSCGARRARRPSD